MFHDRHQLSPIDIELLNEVSINNLLGVYKIFEK
jgi:hypothetical protein